MFNNCFGFIITIRYIFRNRGVAKFKDFYNYLEFSDLFAGDAAILNGRVVLVTPRGSVGVTVSVIITQQIILSLDRKLLHFHSYLLC